ncbi:BamA/TamA family outer membrane protein [Oculatella sp. LEGE 06141]|uniref:BamA/TamA family outer membrane protein n=1 Tax=Oculatella sp. LEGE 06141 TaxID=1828648 RepID=UPI00187EAEE4|nr:BamA/TamA family outer membrane protein [Oculatella sp. LEGE 06141]MBE9182003.1 BamA/TamA family outer membrane protein [Oculatella sp. LEGE 06141]
MRFSPVLLAVFTVSATLGLSNPAKAQAPNSADIEAENSNHLGLAGQPRSAEAEGRGQTVAPAPVQPEWFSSEFLAQAIEPVPDAAQQPLPPARPTEPPQPLDLPSEIDPATPPPGTQTPLEGSPDRIQFDTAPEPSTPQIEFNLPEPTTPPEAQPVPDDGVLDEPPPLPDGTVAPPAQPTQPTQPGATQAEEPRVLVSEVAVEAVEGELSDELLNIVYNAAQTQPGRTTTRSQLQEDINAIFATGFFSNVQAVPEDTPLGVRVAFIVQVNPVLQDVQLEGSQVETLQYQGEETSVPQVVDSIFADQYGTTLNLRDLQVGIEQLNQVYQENGFVLAQVIDVPQVSPDGTVTLVVAEGVIEDIQVRFLNREGQPTNEDGTPVQGQTREFIVTREFESQSGDVFNQQQIQGDLQRVFGLGIFEDVRVSLNPGTDPRQVDVVVNVIERNTGSVAAGVGFSSASGLFGTVSFQEQNLGGNNQRLAAEVQVGERELLFDLSFTDPWIATDPYRTSYTVNAFNRRSISLIFDGGENEVELENGDRPRVNRLGGGVSFSRPLDEWLGLEGWRASAGLQFQRVTVTDADGEVTPRDELGNLLSFNEDGRDNLLLLQLAAVQDRRNSTLTPTSGSVLRFSTEQSLPIDGIIFNRLRASYSYYIPVDFTNFTEGAETLAFNVQAGTILGDLPPYEAFALGGTDSVRGYDSGDLGSGRSFALATVEYRFPIFSIVGGALFADFGTDLGTAEDVPGSPAEVRGKPGSGFGVGLGVRVQSPLGQIRIDYGVNDQGDGRLHFGVGERF